MLEPLLSPLQADLKSAALVSPATSEERQTFELVAAFAPERANEKLDDDGDTPLMWAARNGGPAKALINAKADVSAKAGSRTALSDACLAGRAEMVGVLARAKADLNQTTDGSSLLSILVQNEIGKTDYPTPKVIQALCDAKADVNQADTEFPCNTPLLWACQQHSLSFAKPLLLAGSSTSYKNRFGYNADRAAYHSMDSTRYSRTELTKNIKYWVRYGKLKPHSSGWGSDSD